MASLNFEALALPIISRVKVMSNMNIAERRVPQDGRIVKQIGDKGVYLRVSTLPTTHGESVVLRILDRSNVSMSLTELGLPEEVDEYVNYTIKKPNGIFVVTGPTGAGKTTTLYAALREINTCAPTYYRWKKQYGRMDRSEVKRLREMEKENERLKKLVAELTLDKEILKEALKGK